MSQSAIAEKLGINQTLVSQYERGKLRIHGALVAGFAKLLKVSADEVLGLTKPSNDSVLSDRRFLRRLQRIDDLSRLEKQAILKTLDLALKGAPRP
jgi:transcriptional regulator with XRE-family HTH domain